MTFVEAYYATIGIVGVFGAFFGYRLFKIAISIAGLLSGAIYAFLITDAYYTGVEIWPEIAAGIAGGLVGFALGFWLYKVGVFAAGGLLGAIVARLVVNNIEFEYPYLIIAGMVVGFGILTFTLQKYFLILITSALGSWYALAAYMFFQRGLGLLPGENPIQENYWLDHVTPAIVAIWLGMTFVAFFCQKLIVKQMDTAKKKSSHKE